MSPPTPWLLANALASPVVAPEAPASPQASADALAQTAVHPGAPPPSVIWSWTTADQIAQLREDERLLVRTESPTYGRTAFSRTLARHAAQTRDPLSRLLDRPRFARHRYGWSQPWATSRPPAGERWGQELLRIELQPGAWVAIFRPPAAASELVRPEARSWASDGPVWQVVDLQGAAVPMPQVLADPERIAAVLHHNPQVSLDLQARWNTYAAPTLAFREFVLINEDQIAHVSYGTAQIREATRRTAEQLDALAAQLPEQPGPDQRRAMEIAWNRQLSAETWRTPLDAAALEDPTTCWLGNLAMADRQWFPTRDVAQQTADRMRALDPGPPLVIEHPRP